MSERWKVYADHKAVWCCRGSYDCFQGTGGEYHYGYMAIHNGPAWFYALNPKTPRWWEFWRKPQRSLETALRLAHDWVDTQDHVASSLAEEQANRKAVEQLLRVTP